MQSRNVIDWWMLPNHEMNEVLIRFLVYPVGYEQLDITEFMKLYCNFSNFKEATNGCEEKTFKVKKAKITG